MDELQNLSVVKILARHVILCTIERLVKQNVAKPFEIINEH